MKKKILMCTAGIIALAALAVAQQPKSQKELDALVAIQSATSVDDRMKKAVALIGRRLFSFRLYLGSVVR